MPNTYDPEKDVDLSGVSPTDLEEHVHPFGAGTFAAKNVIQPLPGAFSSQKRIDYDVRTDDNPVYVGYNIRGAATSVTTWVLQKLTYDGSNRITLVQVALDSWDNRAAATYS